MLDLLRFLSCRAQKPDSGEDALLLVENYWQSKMKPHCPTCRHIMHRATDSALMCRRNGRLADPRNAATCGEFDREPGSDDERLVWFDGAWMVDATQDL
jgi:hypothetical protein